jgi:hypothetical protein
MLPLPDSPRDVFDVGELECQGPRIVLRIAVLCTRVGVTRSIKHLRNKTQSGQRALLYRRRGKLCLKIGVKVKLGEVAT